ncbi:MAG: hypothetical protein WB780_06645 [Candidatus Acidiferrales bacterium]
MLKNLCGKITPTLFVKFVALLCAMLAAGAPTLASSYSCGNPSSGHCYGVASWSEKPQYFGAYADILEGSLNCPSGCGGFIDDELWLVDSQSSGCTSNSFGMCWVEAGYIAQENQGTVFFWADSRPLTSSTFNLHLLGGTDPAGTTDHFMIIKDGRAGPGIFQVWIYNDSLSTLYNGTSTSNTMDGNTIDIGQELAGTQNASATSVNFTRNIWAVQVLGPEYVFWYNRQTDEGGLTNASPPSAIWTINPSNPPPPEGGEFTTHCCS